MASNVFRFEENWDIPNASVDDVYDVLAHGELLPLWWNGVYLDARKLSPPGAPKVGDKVEVRARGALPYRLNFVIEAVELEPGRRVVVKTEGDFDGRWSATLSRSANGVRVDLIWEVTVLRPILRVLSPILRSAFAWNHRWTTPRGETGLRDFLAARATSRRS